MHSLSLSSILAATIVSAFAVPTTVHTVHTFAGEKTGRLIVKLKPGVARTNVLAHVGDNVTITHEWDLVNGFAGHLDDEALNALQASPDVLSIHDSVFSYAQDIRTSL